MSQHLLVVDDSEAQFVMIHEMLQALRQEYTFDWAENYTIALELATSCQYDLLLVDYDLDGKSGIDLIRTLKEQGIDAPMVLLTGHGSRKVDLEAMASGAVDYLDKTEVKPAMLERTVRYAINYHKILHDLRESQDNLSHVLETVPVGIFIITDQDTLRYTNDTFDRLADLPMASSHNVSLIKLIHPSDQSQVVAVMQDIPAQVEVRLAERWVSINFSTIQYELQPAILGAMTDITLRKQREEQEREQLTFAEALLDTSNAINSTLELDEVFQSILANMGAVIPHDVAMIVMIEDGFTRVAGFGGDAPLEVRMRKLHLPIADVDDLHHITQSRQPLWHATLPEHSLWQRRFDVMQSFLGAPILLSERVIGFILLFSKTSGFFNALHADRLRIFADQAVIAVRNAQAYEHALEIAAREERQRLARDLHDAVSQTLFSASFMAESLPRLMDHDLDAVRQGLDKLNRMTKGALAEMRTLLMELRPQALVETELNVLLRHLVNATGNRIDDLTIHLEDHTEALTLPPDVKVGLYRIAQEALNNVIKHAQARIVYVTLIDHPQAVELSIEDDGIGFTRQDVPANHFGLNIMEERAHKIDAQLHIHSHVGQGTQIHVEYVKV